MHDSRKTVLPPCALALALTFSAIAYNGMAAAPAKGSQSTEAAADEIKGMIAKYADAVNREPVDLALAASVWADSPDDSLIFPLGEIRGWDHIRQDFYQSIMEGRFSERTLTPAGIEVHAYGDCAWAEFTWRFEATSRQGGSKVETRGHETQIYRKLGPHRWGLVHVQYSSLSAAVRSSASGERQRALDGLASQQGYAGVRSESPQLAAQNSSQETARSQQTSRQHDRDAFLSQSKAADERRSQLRQFASGVEDNLARGPVAFPARFHDQGSQRRDLLRPECSSHDLGNAGDSQAAADFTPEEGAGAGAVQVTERGSNRVAPQCISRTFIAEDGAPAARPEHRTSAAASAGNRSGSPDYNDARRAAQSGLQSYCRISGEDKILRGNIFPQPSQKRTGDMQPVSARDTDAACANPALARTCQGLAGRGKNFAPGRNEANLHRIGRPSGGSAADLSAFVSDPRRGCGAAAIDTEIRVHEWHYTCARIREFHT